MAAFKGMEARADLDLRDVFDGFRDINRAARNLRPVFRTLAPIMKKDQQEHFRLKVGPDGAWPKKAASTRARNKFLRKGRKPRAALLGIMRTAFSVEFSRSELTAISKIPFSGAHQDGARVGRGVNLPKRTHHYMSSDFLVVADRQISQHVFGAWERGAKR